jgi:ABC-2 type transport system ATP-binding protein
LHQPEILFLDEPTQGLDPQTRNKIWEYLQNLNKETQITVFFTTHYMEEAEQIAHRIAIMDHGKIIETGTAAKLMEQTQTKSLEKAFLKLTGTAIRDEEASGVDKLRGHAMRWRGR